jgi:hypothetical protein
MEKEKYKKQKGQTTLDFSLAKKTAPSEIAVEETLENR